MWFHGCPAKKASWIFHEFPSVFLWLSALNEAVEKIKWNKVSLRLRISAVFSLSLRYHVLDGCFYLFFLFCIIFEWVEFFRVKITPFLLHISWKPEKSGNYQALFRIAPNLNFPRFFATLLQLYSRGILKSFDKNSKVHFY